MPQLLLLRHAKSSWDDPKLPDHSRPLNARGKYAAANVGRVIRHIGILPDRVLVSSARRTLQTLEQLEPWETAPKVEVMDALYLASGRVILDLIHDVSPETERLLVVGHNPGLHELGLALANKETGVEEIKLQEGFPTSALAWFNFTAPWSELSERSAELTRFIVPSDVADPGL